MIDTAIGKINKKYVDKKISIMFNQIYIFIAMNIFPKFRQMCPPAFFRCFLSMYQAGHMASWL